MGYQDPTYRRKSMTDMDKLIQSTMNFDPVAEAEKAVGDLNKDNVGVALMFSMEKSREMFALMAATGDTCSRTTYAEYLQIADDLGYSYVYEEKFPGSSMEETYTIMWHSRGFLLTVESYTSSNGEKSVNTAKMYYNIQCHEGKMTEFYKYTSSGHWVGFQNCAKNGPPVWAGDHDVRDALKFKMDNLFKYGAPLSKWVECPHLWLINYFESRLLENKQPYSDRSKEWDRIRDAKINALPKGLREMILNACKKKEG
jgi:hypothetical protein